MLRTYLRALARDRHPAATKLEGGRQIRTCPNCGEETIFVPDTTGSWYRCTACTRYA